MAKTYSRHPKLRGKAIAPTEGERPVGLDNPNINDPRWDTPRNATDPIVDQPVGTKFMAFGENITSPGLNRAVGAVQENLDIVHAGAFSEMAIPHVITLHNDADAGNSLLADNATVEAQLGTQLLPERIYINDGAANDPTTIFSVLDANYNEIIKNDGTECKVASVRPNLSAAEANVIVDVGVVATIQPAAQITRMNAHSITCANSGFVQDAKLTDEGADQVLRPVCPGDKVQISGSTAGAANNTVAGTLDWIVHSVDSEFTLDIRCVQDPSRPLTITPSNADQLDGNYGTATIQPNGDFFVNPTLVLNFNPKDAGVTLGHPTGAIAGTPNLDVSKIYLVCARSRQPVPTQARHLQAIGNGVAAGVLPAAAVYPLEVDSLVKIKLRASEEQDALRDYLATCGLDQAYDKDLSRKDTNPPGSGRTITVDTGYVQLLTSPDGPNTGAFRWADLPSLFVMDWAAYGHPGAMGSVMKSGVSKVFASDLALSTRVSPDHASPLALNAALPVTLNPLGGLSDLHYNDNQVDRILSVVPYATLCKLAGTNNGAHDGYWLVVGVATGGNGFLTLEFLEEAGVPNFVAEDQATASLWAIRSSGYRDVEQNFPVSGDSHGIQLASSEAAVSLLRTLHVGSANTSSHILCLSSDNGIWADNLTHGQQNSVKFQVRGDGRIRVGDKIEGVYTAANTKSLDLNSSNIGLKISSTATVEEGGIFPHHTLEITDDKAHLTSNQNAFLLTEDTSAAGGDAILQVKSATPHSEKVRGTYWEIRSWKGDAEDTERGVALKYRDAAGVEDLQDVLLNETDVFAVAGETDFQFSKTWLGSYNKTVGTAPANNNAVELRFQETVDSPTVRALWDGRAYAAAGDSCENTLDALKNPSRLGGDISANVGWYEAIKEPPDRFLMLGFRDRRTSVGEVNQNTIGDVSTLTITDHGQLLLGEGFTEILSPKRSHYVGGDAKTDNAHLPIRFEYGGSLVVQSQAGRKEIELAAGDVGHTSKGIVTARNYVCTGGEAGEVVNPGEYRFRDKHTARVFLTPGDHLWPWHTQIPYGGDEMAGFDKQENNHPFWATVFPGMDFTLGGGERIQQQGTVGMVDWAGIGNQANAVYRLRGFNLSTILNQDCTIEEVKLHFIAEPGVRVYMWIEKAGTPTSRRLLALGASGLHAFWADENQNTHGNTLAGYPNGHHRSYHIMNWVDHRTAEHTNPGANTPKINWYLQTEQELAYWDLSLKEGLGVGYEDHWPENDKELWKLTGYPTDNPAAHRMEDIAIGGVKQSPSDLSGVMPFTIDRVSDDYHYTLVIGAENITAAYDADLPTGPRGVNVAFLGMEIKYSGYRVGAYAS